MSEPISAMPCPMCKGTGELHIKGQNCKAIGQCTMCMGTGNFTHDPRPANYAVYWAGYKAGSDDTAKAYQAAIEALMQRLGARP